MLSSAVWLHTDQTYAHISGAEQILSTKILKGEKPGDIPVELPTAAPLDLASPLPEKSPSAFRADPMPPSSPYDPWPAARRRPGRRRSGSCQPSIRLTTLVQQLDECVFVAVFKFARFDRLHGRDARGSSVAAVGLRRHIVLKGVPAPEGFTANMNYCLLMEETGTKKGRFCPNS